MTIPFYKYQGTGNDFIIIDNRQGFFTKNNTKIIKHLCDRRFGIGADGLILLENDALVDFKMIYFNADGNESTMCGNGGRCIVAFAHFLNIIAHETTFSAIDGNHFAIIDAEEVSLGMNNVREIQVQKEHVFLDTGSPHHVQFETNLAALNVKEKGAAIRYGRYGVAGSNVNFVEKVDQNTFRLRTYERGVEGETLSCGTGATAVALAMHHLKHTTAEEVQIVVEGGQLKVTFVHSANGYEHIFLKGKASQVFKGEVICRH